MATLKELREKSKKTGANVQGSTYTSTGGSGVKLGDFRRASEKAVATAASGSRADVPAGYNAAQGRSGWEKYRQQQEARRQAQQTRQAEAEEKNWWKFLSEAQGITMNMSDVAGNVNMYKESENRYRDDTSPWQPTEDWTAEEQDVFGYLYGKGDVNGAYAYADKVNQAINREKKTAQIKSVAESATDNFWSGLGHTLASIPAAALGTVDYLDDLAQRAATGRIRERGAITPFEYSQAVQSGIAEDLNKKGGTIKEGVPIIGGKGWGDVYSLGTSVAQSLASAYTLGQVGTLVQYFGSSAAGAVDDALERGATEDQALAIGALSGVAEAIPEMLSVDRLLKIGSSTTMRELLQNIAKQGLAEGAEEGTTTILNNFADRLVMADKSNFNKTVKELMASGLTEEEAKRQAWKSFAGDLAYDVLAGAVSGVVSGGVTTGGKTAIGVANARRVYGESQQELVQEGAAMAEGSAAQQAAAENQQRLDGGKTLSGWQLYRQAAANEQTKYAAAAAQQLRELGEEGDVESLASALAKEAYGRPMTKEERRLIRESENSAAVQEALADASAEEYNRLQTVQEEVTPETAQTAAETANRGQAALPGAPENALQAPRSAAVTETVTAPAEEAAEDQAAKPQGEDSATLEEVAGKYGEQRGAVVSAYNVGGGAQDVEEFARGYGAAYDMGRSGVARSYAMESPLTRSLTAAQREMAYDTGADAANRTAAAAAKKNTAKASGRVGRREGAVSAEGVRIEEMRSQFNDTQRQAYKVLSTLAKATGIHIVLYNSEANEDGKFRGAQGRYDRSRPDTLYLDMNAGLSDIHSVEDLGKYTVLRTFAHEFTHFIENWNPIRYNELRRAVFDAMTENGADVEQLIDRKVEETGLDYDAASREVVAEAMTDMMEESSFVETLAAKHKSIFKKLGEQLREFAARLREYFSSIGSNTSPEARALKKEVDGTLRYVEGIVALFDKAAVEAVENYQQTATVEESGNTVQEQARYAKPNLTQAQWNLLNATMEAEIGQSKNFLDEATKWLYADKKGEQVFALYGIGDGTVPTPLYVWGGGKAVAKYNDFRVWREGKKNETDKNRATLDRIFDTLLSERRRKASGGISSSRQRRNEMGNALLHERESESDGRANRKDGPQTGSGGIQYQQRPQVETDAAGRQLTEAQIEFFKDSQVRDESGRLKIVYHGSGAAFTEFSYRFMSSHGSSEGQGFYFTDKKQMAEGYQKSGTKLLEGYLDIKKPLSDSEVTMTKQELKRLLQEIDPTGDDVILNYDPQGGMGYPGKVWYNRSLAATVNAIYDSSESDSEILAETANSGAGTETVVKAVRKLFGYDGYIVSGKYNDAAVYVAFESNQFKNVDNQNPTDSPDIRFQDRTDALTDWDVLDMAAEELSVEGLTAGEREALGIFKKRLAELNRLQEERQKQGQLFHRHQFGPGGDKQEARAARNRMEVLNEQIRRAGDAVLQAGEQTVLRRVLQEARGAAEKLERERSRAELQRWRANREDAEKIRSLKKSITRDVQAMVNWTLHPDNKTEEKHMPEALRGTVLPFLQSIDFEDPGTRKYTSRKNKAFAEKLRQMTQLLDRAGGMKELEELYGHIDIAPAMQERLKALLQMAETFAATAEDGYTLSRMTSGELQELQALVGNLKALVQNFNRMHQNAVYQHAYEAGENSMQTMEGMQAAKHTGKVSQFLFWQQMRPAYAFERFGEGGVSIYDELRQGQAKLAFHAEEIIEFAQKAYTAKQAADWEKELHTVKLFDGKEIRVTAAQAMSFYELSKREQALGHLLGRGVRVATFQNGKTKFTDEGHLLTEADVKNIIATLTEEQKKVADKLQQYMQEQGSQWGNEVSMIRFGEKQFGEENYFPIHVDGRLLDARADEKPGAASLYALLNLGSTKQVQEGAKNRIVLYSIFDVFSNHMAQMAQYNAMVLPIVDALKWFNYKRTDAGGEAIGSVREEMDRVYGTPEETTPGKGKQGYAQEFVLGILRAFNGTEAHTSKYDNLALRSLSRYNRAQVAYNLRVVVQQPLAVTRAGLLLSDRAIRRGLRMTPAQIKKNAEEMRKHSGIAAWKNLGFYDVNISRGLTSLIKQDATRVQKIVDTGLWAAGKADELTWAAIWNASKEQVRAKEKLTEKDGEAFYSAVTKLFEDVVYKTQVVDSVLTKNEFMRDKGGVAKLIGSFMSEPTTTASMLLDAYDKFQRDMQSGLSRQAAWKRHRRSLGRILYVYGTGAVLLAASQAVADALRDDDDYQTFLKKWEEAFTGNLVDELMPLNKLPIVSDFYELGKELGSTIFGWDTYGNPPASVIMQWYDTLVKGVEIISDKVNGEDTNYTWWGGIYKLLQAGSGIAGLPVAATTREAVTVWNNTAGQFVPRLKIKTYDPGEKASIRYAYQDGYLTDEEAAELLLEQGLEEDAARAKAQVEAWAYADDYDGITASAMEKYDTYCYDAGVELDTFYAAWKHKGSLTGTGEVKEKMMDYIDGLAISSGKKDALYLASGYSEKTMDEAPWH